MPIIDTPKCNLLYSKDAESSFQPRTIKDDMLCAGFAEGKKDACKVGTGVGRAEAEPCSLGPRRKPAHLGQGTRPRRWAHRAQTRAMHSTSRESRFLGSAWGSQSVGLQWDSGSYIFKTLL